MEKLHTKDADMRTANLLSNLYNNLSNTYLLMKRGNEAAKALRTAFDILMKYAHLGLIESHDSLQQMMNLINMLLLAWMWTIQRLYWSSMKPWYWNICLIPLWIMVSVS